nr:patatin-like protein 3 [Ipomoea batatas]
MEVDKLTNQIFSILENKFLFGCDDPIQMAPSVAGAGKSLETGKVRVLSIDAGGSTDGVLAAKSLAHLEASLRRKSGKANAHIADFFDVVAGSGVGGVLAALLFTRGKDGGPLFTAEEALRFIIENGRKISRAEPARVFRRSFKPSKAFKKVFGDLTLKDTLKAVLIPCYDLTTGAPFLFSRADALEMDACDFLMADTSPASFVNIVGDGAADMVDQAISMAFGESGNKSNYVRIQGHGILGKKKERKIESSASIAEEMLAQKNVESVLFQGKKLAQSSNLEKLDLFAGELVKEQDRRKTSVLPVVVLKQASAASPRTSSATTLSSISSC